MAIGRLVHLVLVGKGLTRWFHLVLEMNQASQARVAYLGHLHWPALYDILYS